MIQSDAELLEKISSDLDQIKKALKIVPDRQETITNFEESIENYEIFALDELKIGQGTIDNQKSAIKKFLAHCNGQINEQSVKAYLDSNESKDWKTNQLKAIRRYVRDYLKLGNWIQDFRFSKKKIQLKKVKIPNDNELAFFCTKLPYQVQMIFLILHNSGLRVGEVLALTLEIIDFEQNMIDASDIHEGQTKSAWISFFTLQTNQYLDSYVDEKSFTDDMKLFNISYNYVQECFKRVSQETGIAITPKTLRLIFTEKCTHAGIDEKYINAFGGRTPKGILHKHYTDYSPESLKLQYHKVEDDLKLPFSEEE